MQIKELFDDDSRAVSPVIGVILMVAITVILAAVIGTFVLGLGDQVQNTTPRASFGFQAENLDDGDPDNDELTVTHESGESIDATNLQVILAGTTYDETSTDAVVSSAWSNTVGAGTTYEFVETSTSTNVFASGDTVRVTYSDPNSDNTATLGKTEL